MKLESVIALLLGLAGLVLFTILLALHLVGQASYVALLSGLALVCIVLHGFSRTRELDLKNLKVTLDQIEQAKIDIFAREETVKTLAEDMAQVAVFTATDQLPQLLPSYLLEQRYLREVNRLKTRDKVISVLQSVGADAAKVEEARDAFDSVIRERLVDLFHGFLHARVNEHLMNRDQQIGKEAAEQRRHIDPRAKAELQVFQDQVNLKYEALKPLREYGSRENLDKLITSTNCDLQQIEAVLKANGLWDEKIEEHIRTFGKFLKDNSIDLKKLPTTGSCVHLASWRARGAA